MAPARAMVYLSQRPSTKLRIIRPAVVQCFVLTMNSAPDTPPITNNTQAILVSHLHANTVRRARVNAAITVTLCRFVGLCVRILLGTSVQHQRWCNHSRPRRKPKPNPDVRYPKTPITRVSVGSGSTLHSTQSVLTRVIVRNRSRRKQIQEFVLRLGGELLARRARPLGDHLLRTQRIFDFGRETR